MLLPSVIKVQVGHSSGCVLSETKHIYNIDCIRYVAPACITNGQRQMIAIQSIDQSKGSLREGRIWTNCLGSVHKYH